MNMKTHIIVVVTLLAVNYIEEGNAFCSMKAVTYNTALRDRSIDTQGVIPNNRIERREQIIAMLSNSEADFICLQEVWIAEDVKAIIDGVFSTFPYSHSKIHSRGTLKKGFYSEKQGPLCDFMDMFAVTNCVAVSCSSAATLEDIWNCMNTTCITEYDNFIDSSTVNCISCVISALPNVTGILEMCAGAGIDEDFRKINSPGLLMLSKTKFRNPNFVRYYPEKSMIDRGYLTAKTRGVNVVCTQLSEEIVSFYPETYVGRVHAFMFFEDQNLGEAGLLISGYGSSTSTVILGDFNSGLAGDGINATIAASHTTLDATFVTRTASDCTVCDRDENPYNVDNENYITSGVFGKGIKIRDIVRVFTMDEGCITYNGQDLPLSDHFGVETIITNDQ